MVAGATGIDLYLMAIAADDGVMPQTREHAAVLRALGVARGVVAVTKADLADPDLAVLEAAELLPGAEVVAVSAAPAPGSTSCARRSTGSPRGSPGARGRGRRRPGSTSTACSPIRGAGTVVTGTLWSGAIARGDELTLLPGDRRPGCASVQVHDAAVERARKAGQRVAVNLGRDRRRRGSTAATC